MHHHHGAPVYLFYGYDTPRTAKKQTSAATVEDVSFRDLEKLRQKIQAKEKQLLRHESRSGFCVYDTTRSFFQVSYQSSSNCYLAI